MDYKVVLAPRAIADLRGIVLYVGPIGLKQQSGLDLL